MSADICLTYIDALFLALILLFFGTVIGRLTSNIGKRS